MEPQLGKKKEEGGSEGGGGASSPDEAAAKRIRQAVYDIRYRARREDIDVAQAYSQYMSNTSMAANEKSAVRDKLGLGTGGQAGGQAEEVEHVDEASYTPGNEKPFPYGKVGDKLRKVAGERDAEKDPKKRNKLASRLSKMNREYNLPEEVEHVDEDAKAGEHYLRVTPQRGTGEKEYVRTFDPKNPSHRKKRHNLEKRGIKATVTKHGNPYDKAGEEHEHKYGPAKGKNTVGDKDKDGTVEPDLSLIHI